MGSPTPEHGGRLRENALCVILATVGAGTMAWLGLVGFAWNDYEVEALPAFHALLHGQLESFLRLAPAYGGSLVLRAPFAVLPKLWGGGDLAVYRSVAVPCLLAASAFGVWLVAQMRRNGQSRLARSLTLGLCVANPLTLLALEVGHPEELLGGVLCVAAVLLADREHPILAGLALGAAFANKEWALLALGPVLIALPAKRAICVASASALAAAVLAPLLLVGSSTFVTSAHGTATAASTIFQPWQIWWFLGHHGTTVHGLFGSPKPGYRTAAAWIDTVSHPLIVVSMPVLSMALWLRMRRTTLTDALLLLTVLLLGRCLLDIWDTSYYFLPFLLSLLTWESLCERRPAILSLGATVLAWIDFKWLPMHASADVQSIFFLAWTLPLVSLLLLRLYAPRRGEALLARIASLELSAPVARSPLSPRL